MPESDTKTLSYEKAYQELEEIVERLESEEPDLDRLVGDYEKASGLLKTCQKKLRDAELKIEVIRKTRDGFESDELPEPFAASEEKE